MKQRSVNMSKSIICNTKECLICKNPTVHKHHLYGGVANRKLSEKYGLWVYLCPWHHNLSNAGVHFNKALDTKLKKHGQKVFEEKYSREEFIEIFGKSYL